MAVHLHGNVSKYVELRYFDALSRIRDFVQIGARALGDLRPGILVKLSRAEARVAEEDRTDWEEMRSDLAFLRRRLSADDFRRPTELINDIEHLVSKERLQGSSLDT